MSFQSLKAPKVPPPQLHSEVKKSEVSIQLEALMEDFAGKFRKRSLQMGRDPEQIPAGEMVKAYKFKHGITPLNEDVDSQLATQIRKQFYRMKSQRGTNNA